MLVMRSIAQGRAKEALGTGPIALGLLALVALAVAIDWLYPRAFPLRAEQWELRRGEAIEVALAAALDLGELPERPYVSATLATQESLELRLLGRMRSARPAMPADLARERRLLHVWRVSVFAPGAPVDRWAYVAEIALDGEVLTLLRATEPDFASSEVPERQEAIERAADFLELQGVDLDSYEAPQLRRVELESFSYTLVSYTARRGAIESGVEVRFAGGELRGMRSWISDADEELEIAIAESLRTATLAQTFRLVVVFLFVPFLAVYFIRRYHQGVVGVRNGVRVFWLLLGAAALLLLLVVRGVADGSSMSNVSRQQMTWLVTALMLVVYFPALGALALMGTALADSSARGLWRRRLAAFDGLLDLRWQTSTVAVASLRGVVAGVVLAAALLAAAALLPELGVEVPYSFSLGPWWPSAAFPGVALVLAMLVYSLIYCCFGLILFLPPLVDRLGRAAGVAIVALLASLVFFPPLNTVPAAASLAIAFLAGLFAAALYLRFDLAVALLASLVSAAVLGALPLLHARDPWLELQGWAALLIVASPALLGFRSLQHGAPYRYSHDDVPAHVRRIAERERQRVEIETARQIQSSILPRLPEEMNGVELAHLYVPASEVGGDFYDVVAIGDDRLAVGVGDVAGHGVSSGLIMSMVRAALAVQVGYEPRVESVLETLNRVVFESARGGRRLLTTFCYLLLDVSRRELAWASAGHIYPYRLGASGRLDSLESTAYPLGVRRNLEIEVQQDRLDPGDLLFLCSDGLVEARRFGSDEPFGFERLEESLRRHAGRSAAAVLEGVRADLWRFVGAPTDQDVSCEDDLTLLVLRLPGEQSVDPKADSATVGRPAPR
ncbi:MAG: hypothetical protein DWQ30_18825 [Acidobacteria bacterium]|nr:MAG: hypothetical protein DWQ30_18825 [Acidobacteriota bacterium]